MKIKDFIQGRDVSYSSVFQYIKRNPNLFKGHIGNKNNVELDDVAVELLEQKYPTSKPVQVIEDNEARRQLIEAQQLIIQLQQQLVEAAPKIAWAEQNKVLLDIAIEDKERLLIENNKLKEEKEAALEKERQLERELESYEKTFFGLYRKR